MKRLTDKIPYASLRKDDMRDPNAGPDPSANMYPLGVDSTHPKLPRLLRLLPSVAMM